MSPATNTMTSMDSESMDSVSMDSDNMDSESIKKYLFQKAMKSQWEEIVRAYGQNRRAHKARITKSGDTALHIAVSDGQEEHVEELVKLVSKKELEIQNERGNTPLHFAAAQGNVRMCECIARDRPSLVGILNKDKETPLFLAALHGKKDAFLCLHYICTPDKSPPNYNYCRREDGETILHCAISRDYFDLAFQIIALYKDLVSSVNEVGFSPLHLLASKPSAFKSGSQYLRSWDIIIYHCTLVDKLKVEEADHFHERIINTINSENAPKYPENYKTCINFLLVFWKMAQVLVTRKGCTDPENPEPKGGNPGHYNACFDYVKLLSKAMLIVLGLGSTEIQNIKHMKEKHKWAVQIMDKLLESAMLYTYEDSGMNPQAAPILSHMDDETTRPYKISDGGDSTTLGNIEEPLMTLPPGMKKKETPILIAAKNGVIEMVEKILGLFPVAIYDLDAQKKNIVLLAVENRQPHVYQLLLKRKFINESVFGKLDKDGNSALHLAAKLGEYKRRQIHGAALQIHGAALQMQWEIKWYEFVKNSMPRNFFVEYNMQAQTAKEIFTDSHTNLVRDGTEWLCKTSESCSVVAALIVTVAFATATTVPGGINQDTGRPTFENHPGFELYTLSSLVAVCFSFTSMVIFLSIVMSQPEQEDFGKAVPWKLLLGLTTLFLSTVAMLMSFCIGHSFILKHNHKYAAFPVYVVSCSPIAYFLILQFPVYYNLVRANFRKVPVRRLNKP